MAVGWFSVPCIWRRGRPLSYCRSPRRLGGAAIVSGVRQLRRRRRRRCNSAADETWRRIGRPHLPLTPPPWPHPAALITRLNLPSRAPSPLPPHPNPAQLILLRSSLSPTNSPTLSSQDNSTSVTSSLYSISLPVTLTLSNSLCFHFGPLFAYVPSILFLHPALSPSSFLAFSLPPSCLIFSCLSHSLCLILAPSLRLFRRQMTTLT